MARPILFLDIDGVLNGHEFNAEAESTSMVRACVRQLNRIIVACRPRIVISSAWRYLVLEGAMTASGFQSMLRTHGVHRSADIIDTTVADERIPTRGGQIVQWLGAHGDGARFAILDDLDLDISTRGLPFVQTRKDVGLTEADADRVIALLTGASQ